MAKRNPLTPLPFKGLNSKYMYSLNYKTETGAYGNRYLKVFVVSMRRVYIRCSDVIILYPWSPSSTPRHVVGQAMFDI